MYRGDSDFASRFARLLTSDHTLSFKGGITMATAQLPRTKVDPVQADSQHYTVECENEKIRVVRIKYGAREESVMHSHPESVSVFLNDCKAKFTYPDGKSEHIEAKASQVMHMDALK
jgi:hypothetical protein